MIHRGRQANILFRILGRHRDAVLSTAQSVWMADW